MRPVYIAGFAQLPNVAEDNRMDEAEMVQRVTEQALGAAGMGRKEVGFTCSGSNDYVMGRPFSFTLALDGLGAWPPISESHVEMDGAWALYEAWVHLQMGHVDTALCYSFGKSSLGPVDDVKTLELDPYSLAPLGVGPDSLAALQARVLLESGGASEADLAAVVARSYAAAKSNPNAWKSGDLDVAELLAAPYVRNPLRAHDKAVGTDGAAAMVICTVEKAKEWGKPYAVIGGYRSHYREPQSSGHARYH